MARVTWFCIDIEASGPVPALYDMISLGGMSVHEGAQGLRLGEPFYMELRPEGPKVDPGAMAVNGLDIEALRRDGLTRAEGMRRLSQWVQGTLDPGAKAVFVGHNAPFDWSFVSWCYNAEDMPNPFGYKALDTKALAAGVLNLHWLDSSKEILSGRLNLPREDMGQKHRADYDAWYQALILKGLLEHQRAQQA